MFVASCSSFVSPPKTIPKSIQSLSECLKVERIYIHAPFWAPDGLPEWISQHQKVQVVHCPDFGALTCVAPLLDYQMAADTGVILFQENHIYPSNWLEELMTIFDQHGRRCAIGRSGSFHKYVPFQYNSWNTEWEEERFLTLKSEFGAIYPYDCFPLSTEAISSLAKKYLKMDLDLDLILASWCDKSQTPLYVAYTSPNLLQSWMDYNGTLDPETPLSRQLRLGCVMMGESDLPIPWADIGTISGLTFLLVGLLIFFMILLL
jgi:hypothetical protein